ncbi:MAG: M23 family metallopeptidase [Ruminococcaceae bacterium]|nr:M23 family metallopeptidase [Oscillospiraceae bacterium]
MEQVYRRRSQHMTGRQTQVIRPLPNYKKNVIGQSIVCLLLFLFCLFVKMQSENPQSFAPNAIRFILENNTDFTAIPQQVHSFFSSLTVKENSLTKNKSVLTSLVIPADAPITSPFGLRTHPSDGTEKFHYGVDIGAPEGEKIKCAAKGKAIEVGNSSDYGNYILVQHADEIYTLYAHCQTVLPKTGDEIQSGQVIATVGATGNVTGPHLHFELRNGDSYLDPTEFISFRQDAAHD